jgi:predicted Zn-dependent protease
VKAVIDAAAAKKLVAAGFFNRMTSATAFLNSKGNFGYERGADSRLTTTIRQPDGSSSGWAGRPSTRIAEISGAEIAARAIEKCLRWKSPAKLEPGKYTVVLEPTAVSDLIALLSVSFGARATEEGRTFFSKKGGGTLLGEKLFPEHITLRSDPFDRRFRTQLWSQDNVPHRQINWIEKGVLKNLIYDRYWALKSGSQPTPVLSSLILDGGEGSTADLIKDTERGLLVTRFWYIRMVNPQTSQVTGLTRDGVFLIENGQVTKPAMNFRFNESRLRLLQNVKRLGRPERVQGAEGPGMIAPPVQAADFPFTSISDAI